MMLDRRQNGMEEERTAAFRRQAFSNARLPSIDEQIIEARRVLGNQQREYERRTMNGTMAREEALQRIETMRAVVRTLEMVRKDA